LADAVVLAERQQTLIGHFLAVRILHPRNRVARPPALQAFAIAGQHQRITVRSDRVIEVAVGPLLRSDVIVVVGCGEPRSFLKKRAASPWCSTLNPIMSASSSPMPSGWKSEIVGRGFGLRSTRSHAFKRTRCLMDLTTEGLALTNSILNQIRSRHRLRCDPVRDETARGSMTVRSFGRGWVSFPRIRFLISNPPSSLIVFSEAITWVTAPASENGINSRS
jgi:hypothetical protein